MNDFDRAKLMFENGIDAFKNEEFKNAKVYFEKSLKLIPNRLSTLNNYAATLIKLENYEEAKDVCEKVIKIDSKSPEAYLNYGEIYFKEKNYDIAIFNFTKAIEYNNNYVEAYYNLGNVYKETKKLDAALIYYEKAININPHFDSAICNKGLVLHKLGYINEAIATFDSGLTGNPNIEEYYFYKGNILLEKSNFEGAIYCYENCININVDFFEAHYNRGIALHKLMFLKESINSFNKAININHLSAESYINKGNCFLDMRMFSNAIENYNLAISINSELILAYINKASALKEIGEINEAKKIYINALRINPNDNKIKWLIAFLNIPNFFIKKLNLNILRNNFESELLSLGKLINAEDNNNIIEIIGSTLPFYLSYQERDNKKLLLLHGNICCNAMLKWQKKIDFEKKLTNNKKIIKIGIIGDHFRNHSVWRALINGIIDNIDSIRFELYIFNLSTLNDEITNYIKSKIKNYFHNISKLEDWVKLIKKSDVDVLIYPEIGMHQLTFQLACLRLSQIQMAMWGHPETTGLNTIDIYLSAELFETEISQENYSEKLFNLPNLGCTINYKEKKYSNINILDKLELFHDDKLLICPGTLFKYAPEYDYIFPSIAKKISNSKFIFFNRTTEITEIFKKRLYIAFKLQDMNFENHTIFLDWLSQEDFYGLMEKSTVFLDTIGFSGFNTALQAVECSLPIVTRKGLFMRGRLATGILKRISLDELIVNTEEEYINLAVKLVNNKFYNDKIRSIINKNKMLIYNDLLPIRSVEKLIINLTKINN